MFVYLCLYDLMLNWLNNVCWYICVCVSVWLSVCLPTFCTFVLGFLFLFFFLVYCLNFYLFIFLYPFLILPLSVYLVNSQGSLVTLNENIVVQFHGLYQTQSLSLSMENLTLQSRRKGSAQKPVKSTIMQTNKFVYLKPKHSLFPGCSN